jgi:Protein of unknown function (DUF2782)
MRRLLATALLLAAMGAGAQGRRVEVPPPPPLEPVPRAPAAPGAAAVHPEEPVVIIPAGKDDKVEEFNQGGNRVVKVTPPGGRPYYLYDTSGYGSWERRESLDSGVRVPMWPIYTFD